MPQALAHLHEIWHYERCVVVAVAAVDQTLRHELTAADTVLQGHGCDILAILQFIQLLDATSDLKVTPVNNAAQIASAEKLLAYIEYMQV
jgi:hypothetical protein